MAAGAIPGPHPQRRRIQINHFYRYLQWKLEDNERSIVDAVFEECYENFVELMTDPFANYLVQKLFEYSTDAQRLLLIQRCAPVLPVVCINMHGTRAVQRMIDFLSTREQVETVCTALYPSASSLMKDINGYVTWDDGAEAFRDI